MRNFRFLMASPGVGSYLALSTLTLNWEIYWYAWLPHRMARPGHRYNTQQGGIEKFCYVDPEIERNESYVSYSGRSNQTAGNVSTKNTLSFINKPTPAPVGDVSTNDAVSFINVSMTPTRCKRSTGGDVRFSTRPACKLNWVKGKSSRKWGRLAYHITHKVFSCSLSHGLLVIMCLLWKILNVSWKQL